MVRETTAGTHFQPGQTMCPVCLTHRWPWTRACPHKRLSQKQRCARRASAHIHAVTRTEAHRIAHHMRLMGKVMHFNSYVQIHASAQPCTHTRVRGHSWRTTKSSCRTHTAGRSFANVGVLNHTSHTHALKLNGGGSFYPETS